MSMCVGMVNELDRSVIPVLNIVKLSVARHSTENMHVSYTRDTTEGDLLEVQTYEYRQTSNRQN